LESPPPAKRSQALRDVVASLGFSNLILSHNLAVLLDRANVYFTRDSQRDLLLGWLISLAFLTVIIYGFVRLYRIRPGARVALTVFAVPAVALALYSFGRSIGLTWSIVTVPLAVGTVLAPAGALRAQKVSRLPALMAGVFKLSAFYAVVCIGSAFWSIAHPYYAPSFDAQTTPDLHAPIVWVIFDELDEGWLFDHRPAGIYLPEFDAFRSHSVWFSNAQRPGPETLISLPALIGGRSVISSKPISDSGLEVEFAGSPPERWSSRDSVFEGMAKLGRSSALVGFYHNYGAVFAPAVSHIRSEGLVAYGIPAALEYQLYLFLPTGLRTELEEALGDNSLWNRAFVAQGKIRLAHQLSDSRKAIEDWRSGFIFLHICLPHAPWINGHLDSSHRGYLSNLRLTDEFLKQIRLSLQKMGEWDSSTVLVSADHNYRQVLMGTSLNQKVPLLVKLPAETSGLASVAPVRAIDERWLLEAIAQGKIKSPQQAVDFMTERARG
jgi:hypothetical protein